MAEKVTNEIITLRKEHEELARQLTSAREEVEAEALGLIRLENSLDNNPYLIKNSAEIKAQNEKLDRAIAALRDEYLNYVTNIEQAASHYSENFELYHSDEGPDYQLLAEPETPESLEEAVSLASLDISEDGRIKDMDKAHTMALAGHERRSRAAALRTHSRLSGRSSRNTWDLDVDKQAEHLEEQAADEHDLKNRSG